MYLRIISFFFISVLSIQAQDSTFISLNGIIVSANIIGSDIKTTGRNVTIIDRKMIEQSPVKTIDGILQYALNVDVRSRSAMGVQADISIRGGHYDQTLILLDGVKINDPQTGHHSMNLPIPITQIERIELLQGGASRIFGPSAFSGIVNIISKKIDKNSIGFIGIGGENALRNLGLNGQAIYKEFYFAAYLDQQKSGDYIKNTAFDKKIASLKAGKNYRNGFFEFSLGSLSNKFGASNFYHPKFDKQYEEVASVLATTSWVHNFSNKLIGTLRLNYRKHTDLYDFNNYRNTNKLASVNFHETDVFDGEWKFKVLNRFGHSAFGIEFRKESVLSNRLGESLVENIAVKNYSGIFYTKSKIRNNASGFVEHQKTWKNLTLSAGSLLNYNSQFGFAFYPGADLTLKINKENILYSTINRSLRFPTFTELYLNTSTVKADPNLQPEKALTYEIGYKYFGKTLNSNYSVFYRKTTDAIDKVKRLNVGVPTMENINDINMFGVEMSQKIDFTALLGTNFWKSLNFNYAFLQADRTEENFQSFYTLNYLRHKFSAGLDITFIKKLNMGIWYTFKNRKGSYQWDAISPALAYNPIHLVDERISYTIKHTRVFMDINNVFDLKYFEHGFVELPGRWISGGFSIEF